MSVRASSRVRASQCMGTVTGRCIGKRHRRHGNAGSSGNTAENHTVLAAGSFWTSTPHVSASELTMWSPRPRGASADAASGVGKPSAVSVTDTRTERPPSISSTVTSNSVAACCTALVASSESMRARDSATSSQSSGMTWQRKRLA